MHGIEEWPLIDEYGMDISPSSYTKVALTEVSLISFQIQSLLLRVGKTSLTRENCLKFYKI